MNIFRFLLGVLFTGTLIYTIQVGINHGWNLLTIFFEDIFKMTWAGQFNLDFMCLLILSGLWMAWRNQFTWKGIVLGLLGVVGGILVLSSYLFILSFQVDGNTKKLFLGNRMLEE